MSCHLPKASAARLALTLCLVAALPARAAAWGPAAHRIIAHVAAANLTPAADKAVRTILVKEDLAAASTYADEVRAYRPETTAWHFVEMPRGAQAYVPSRDCVYTSRGDCAVAAIQRLEKILRGGAVGVTRPDVTDSGKSGSGRVGGVLTRGFGAGESRADALKFLVHLVADIHQPLHCGYKDDAGGNRVRVSFNSTDTNLHALWDTHLVAFAQQSAEPKGGLGEAEYASRRLLPRLGDQITQLMRGGNSERARAHLERLNIERMKNAAVGDWAFESYALARRVTDDACRRSGQAAVPQKARPKSSRLKAKPGGTLLTSAQSTRTALGCAEQSAARPIALGSSYYAEYEKELDEQMLWAGVRLALLLNDIFK